MEADETWPALQRRFSCFCLYHDFFIFQIDCLAQLSFLGIRNSKITSRLLSGGPLPRASREACAKFLLLVLACAFHQKPADEPSRWLEEPQYLLPHKKVPCETDCSRQILQNFSILLWPIWVELGRRGPSVLERGSPCGDFVDCCCMTQHAFDLDSKFTGHSGMNRGTAETISV